MSDYGGYQQKRAHALGPFASVYEATGPDGKGRFALKIFHPPASTRIRRAYEIEGFLLAGERQQKAAKKDGAVLEVVAFGRCPEGAYVVMPWQERSLEPYVDTLSAKGDLLRAMAELLLNALEQWGTQTGGSHRKLKASNVFLTRSGPLQATTAVLSDPWFQLGVKSDGPPRRNDLAAVGAILAQIVRRREVAAWPIEDAPEWKALGRAGKAWLAYVNFLMDPQPASGELTIAEARKRLRAIPTDANPARTAAIIGIAAMVVVAGGVAAFARFGDPIYMPGPVYQLAVTLRNPKAFRKDVTPSWPQLVRAWDSWLGDLQNNAPRLLRNDKLWSGPNDPLRVALLEFSTNANNLALPKIVPEVGNEKRVGVLVDPPDALRQRLLATDVADRVDAAWSQVLRLAGQLERWPRWQEMRDLQAILEARGFNRAVGALQPKLPQAPGTAGYKLDTQRTTKLFNDVSLDETGTLLLASRWNALTKVKTDMEATTRDRIQVQMPRLVLERLRDTGSIGNFAESLSDPLDELNQRRQRFLDPQVVRERFLAESDLLKETGAVTAADFPRWEEQLALYSKVPATDDPRQTTSALAQYVEQLPKLATDLEADAPAAEPDGPATLSTASFATEFQQRTAELAALKAKEIVRIDLPKISEETKGLVDRFQVLQRRIDATIVLLQPETWLAKVAQAYGKFNDTKQRWATWQRVAVNGVSADSLRGPANREKFRALRAQERQVRAWIDGLEGAEGLGALAVPDLSAFTPETADALRQLEAARREQAASAADAAVEWRNGLPQVAWAAASATVREPVEAHRQWLANLPALATDLDRLATLLAGGFSWTEGVSEVTDRLGARPGVDALTGKPAESVTEARLLGQLVASSDRGALVAAAQSGKLSRMLTAWRRLGAVAGWPANAADLDVDGGVVESLRQIVPATVADESRRAGILDELGRETRVRWNRAARNSASNVDQMTAVFERMAKYKISEDDLEDPARYNLNLWQLKRSDWSEVEIAPLRQRRDDFLRKVRPIAGAMAQPSVKGFVDSLSDISLVVDPNRARTASPRLAGWKEELIDDGLGLTATWKAGSKTVKLDFSVIQPADPSLAPFYLARRDIAVGEFIDLMEARPRDQVEQVMSAMPPWARGSSSLSKPFDQPLSWRPRDDFNGFELNPSWFNPVYLTAPVKGLSDDRELRAQYPFLDQAMTEAPTVRSPLQAIPPTAAKILVEKMLGARLPTTREWEAIMKMIPPTRAGNFRGPVFQKLFTYLQNYNTAGQVLVWRPTTGAFKAAIVPAGGGKPVVLPDDGASAPGADRNRLWFSPVDEGPTTETGNFVNLTGNVWIYLQGAAPNEFFVAGGSALSPPGIDLTSPQKAEQRGLIGAKSSGFAEGFSDVGIRPAFDAPPGFKERYKFLELVRKQGFLTW
jgi:hypothetical protein